MGISTPGLAIFIGISYNVLRKLLIKRESEKLTKTTGKKIYRWGMGIIAFMSILSIIFVLDLSDNASMKWFWSIFISFALGFQSFMHWKFQKRSREYIVPILVLILSLIYIIIFI